MTLDIKMGFKTFQPDASGMSVPKRMYYVKACKFCEELVTDQDHLDGAITQARYLSMKDALSSSASDGFRINAARLRSEVVPLHQLSMTISVFHRFLVRAAIQPRVLAMAVQELKKLHATLEASELFMCHSLYASSLLLILHDDPEAETPVAVRIIDVAGLVARERQVTHVLAEESLPLASEDLQDGYLTGLENLISFLECFDSNDTSYLYHPEEEEEGPQKKQHMTPMPMVEEGTHEHSSIRSDTESGTGSKPHSTLLDSTVEED